MLHKNLMNVLLSVTALGALLTGYNAFVANSDDGHTATDHVADYLNLSIAKAEKSDGATTKVVVGGDNQTKPEVNVDNGVAAPAVGEPTEAAKESSPSVAQKDVAKAGDKAATTYEVKEGDTYGCIAEKYYGSFEHWVDVINANPTQTGFTEYGLHVGVKVVLPAITAANTKPASQLCS